MASNAAAKENNSTALPLLATYSLLSGYTLSGLLAVALGTAGVGIAGIGSAALACGVVFIAARQIGSNLSEEDGFALTRTIGMGIIALLGCRGGSVCVCYLRRRHAPVSGYLPFPALGC